MFLNPYSIILTIAQLILNKIPAIRNFVEPQWQFKHVLMPRSVYKVNKLKHAQDAKPLEIVNTA